MLRAELDELEAQHAQVQTSVIEESDRTRQLAELNGRIGALNGRIASARVVDPHHQPTSEVRFGASVLLRSCSGKSKGEERRYTIVGVDEADAAQGRIAFTAPIARAMQGKHVGERITLRTLRGEDVMEIMDIHYQTI